MRTYTFFEYNVHFDNKARSEPIGTPEGRMPRAQYTLPFGNANLIILARQKAHVAKQRISAHFDRQWGYNLRLANGVLLIFDVS